MGLAIANVHAGFATFGGEPAKLNWATIASSECSSALDGSFEDESEIENCVGPTGLYEAHDLIMLGFGTIPLIVAFLGGKKKRGRRASGQSKKLKAMKRKYSRQLSIGITLLSTAITGLVSSTSLVGLDPSMMMLETMVLVILGLRYAGKGWGLRKQVIRLSAKFEEAGGEAADGHSMAIQERMFRDNRMGDPFKGKLKVKGVKDFRTIGEMRRSMNLDRYDDAFEAGLIEDDDEKMGQTCHYCSGQGCAQCNMTGELHL